MSLSIACTPQYGSPVVQPGDSGADSDSDSDSDADSDADAGTDAGSDAGNEWVCPGLVTSICDDEGYLGAYEFVSEAADLGDGIVYVDAARFGVLLAERPNGVDGTEPILVVGEWGADLYGEPGDYAIVTLDAESPEPLRAVDLVAYGVAYSAGYGFLAYDMIIGYPAVALLCGDSGCALYAMVVDDVATARLAPIPNGEVPFADTRGLIQKSDWPKTPSPEDPVCAFGDGLACFDGVEWTEEIATGGPTLLAASVYGYPSSAFLVLTGEACRLVRQDAEGFTEIPLGCDADLQAVDAYGDFFAAGGDGILVLGFPDETLECPFAGHDIVQMRAYSWSLDSVSQHMVTAFTESAGVIDVQYNDYAHSACTFADPLAETARALTMIGGDDWFGTMVVTESFTYKRSEGGGIAMD
jgi:hypothetical protein